jgi:hypothetical protein
MKPIFKKSYFVLGVTCVVVLIANQNCGQPGDLNLNAQQGSASTLGCTLNCPTPTPAPTPAPTPTPTPTPPPISDFQCKSFVTLALGNSMQIPARDGSGTCYAVKLLNAIANSASSLTAVTDSEVVSRNHDTGAATRNPYVLGSDTLEMTLADRRFVKLSGSASQLAPIKVDNFILSGIYPSSGPNSTNFYRAYGTADSTIPGTKVITLRGDNISLQPFGPAGTSTVNALDITSDIIPGSPYTLDLRALDCGGSRELSDVYLLFQ